MATNFVSETEDFQKTSLGKKKEAHFLADS